MLMFKKLFFLIIFVVFVFFGVLFSSENQSSQTLHLFGYSTPELDLGLLIMITLLIGTLLGWLLSLMSGFFVKKSLVKQDKIIKKQDEELRALRVASLKD
ncbi:LapA family protein [bacterium]|nr:LapA family protein [bacterium]